MTCMGRYSLLLVCIGLATSSMPHESYGFVILPR